MKIKINVKWYNHASFYLIMSFFIMGVYGIYKELNDIQGLYSDLVLYWIIFFFIIFLGYFIYQYYKGFTSMIKVESYEEIKEKK